MPNLEFLDRWDLGCLEVRGPIIAVRGAPGISGCIGKTYKTRSIGSAVVEAIIKRYFRFCEISCYRVCNTAGTPHHARQEVASTKNIRKNVQEGDGSKEKESETTEVRESTWCEHRSGIV